MKIQMTAKNVTKSAQLDNQFEIPEGYQKMSMTDFTKMFGGGQ